ncbi:mucin-2-like isoform X1 [Helicoverpa zea]|uniref:mucin-2-like isoform X1 n=1 Tax=Helicoverpa zea TaxID=7113 RepID=UPI001F599562|nr:mucin-2-like isoform X1 [Helicoverpa zea]
MAYMRVRSLFVLTLLQLCRAEISDSLPESWYSANVINDGFQPKPITEIFSTESPFSTTNPIVVLPKESSSVPDEILLLSTLPPPRKISTTGSSSASVVTIPSSTPLPPSVHTLPPSSVQTSAPTTFPTTPYQPAQPELITQFTEQTQPPSEPAFSIQPEIQQTPEPQQPSGPPLTQSQQIRFELVPGQSLPDQPSTQRQQLQTSTLSPLSNYFLIYQQAPQSIQGIPGQFGTSQEVPQTSTVGQVPTTRTPATVFIQPAPTVSPPSTRTAPPTSTTSVPSTARVQTTTRTTNCQNLTNTPQSPLYPLRIRVVAPSGSITNVNFNTPGRTTTTRRPTTTRTRRTSRPRKNNYETCTDGCRGRREPICAAPLASGFLDPNTLKGFPSVCHMACHNSYRKDRKFIYLQYLYSTGLPTKLYQSFFKVWQSIAVTKVGNSHSSYQLQICHYFVYSLLCCMSAPNLIDYLF